jgi:hypothetical protein
LQGKHSKRVKSKKPWLSFAQPDGENNSLYKKAGFRYAGITGNGFSWTDGTGSEKIGCEEEIA